MTENNLKPGSWKPSPAKRLEAGFRTVLETRMKGMPFLHPHVNVEAVGFRPWKHFWFGVMVTPWSMNFILAEGEVGAWKSVPEGQKVHYNFPAGCYDFISVKDDLLGEYQMCSLFSPLDPQITNHAFAIKVAEAAIDAIMQVDNDPPEEGQALVPEARPTLSEKVEAGLQKPVSRRALFHPNAKDEDEGEE
ncbi:MAG TPA: [NiFe]-hydrogenase assembly, chaperone, HybE [Sutterella sp.]|nr:[NiFe]-hydrogenase assembly, chaperone, HybE [Sutterella sp.]